MDNRKFKVLLFIFICLVIVGYSPLKFAKNINKYSVQNNEYIICQETKITAYNWKRITGYYDVNLLTAIKTHNINTEYFNFYNDSIINYPYYIHPKNIYIVYIDKLDKPFNDEFYENIKYICKDWEIVYPIHRETPFSVFLPQRYLCLIDILENYNTPVVVGIEIIYFFLLIILFIIISLKIVYAVTIDKGDVKLSNN